MINSSTGGNRPWPFARGSGVTILAFSSLLLAAIAWWWLSSSIAAAAVLTILFFLWLLVLYFFRDPVRNVVAGPNTILAPGDGKVVEIVEDSSIDSPLEKTVRISIFLSLLDVHVQRAPASGQVVKVTHRPGRFLQAFKPEASEVNEHISMLIESEYGPVVVKQIAGILARRCVNYATVGEEIGAGELFGLIRFSSRVDLFLPTDTFISVKVGDKVKAGLTAIGTFADG